MNMEIKQSRQIANIKFSQIDSKVDKFKDKNLEIRQQKEILPDVVDSFEHVSFVFQCEF